MLLGVVVRIEGGVRPVLFGGNVPIGGGSGLGLAERMFSVSGAVAANNIADVESRGVGCTL